MSEAFIGRTVVIDDKGQTWPNVFRLLTSLGRPIGDSASTDFLINFMGCVIVTAAERRVQLRLRPSLVSGPTLARAFFLLGDLPPSQCSAITFDDNGRGTHVILPPSNQCAGALERIVQQSRAPTLQVLSTRPLGGADLNHARPLLRAFQYWQRWSAEHDETAFDKLLNSDLEGRFVIFSSAESGWRIKRVGDGLPEFARKTLSALKKSHTSTIHPDADYGTGCASAYSTALERWEPLAEEVEAKAFWPEFGRLRRRYTRLILPIPTNGRRCVLSATLPTRRRVA
jgi:hypothetical protein